MAETNNIYDHLAPSYREYAEGKRAYIDGVDKFIRQRVEDKIKSYLDVGSGDGVRAMKIAGELNIENENIVLMDSSLEMVERCKEKNPAQVWHMDTGKSSEKTEKFDLVTCLWNVLGHIDLREKRVEALGNMKNLLSDDGFIFFDVNNRHNAPAYGRLKVLGRVIIDKIMFDEKRGDASFMWNINGVEIPAKGHLFVPSEMLSIIRESGLKVVDYATVNYATGKISKSFFGGQMVFKLSKS